MSEIQDQVEEGRKYNESSYQKLLDMYKEKMDLEINHEKDAEVN